MRRVASPVRARAMRAQGTLVLCDWSLYPGSDEVAPPTEGKEFMEYLSKTGGGNTMRHKINEKEVFTVSSWQGVI